jgi:hypothetical protein
MPHDGPGYVASMSNHAPHANELPEHDHDHQHPVDLGQVPPEEGVSQADAAERVDEDPDEQQNRKDPVWDDEDPED